MKLKKVGAILLATLLVALSVSCGKDAKETNTEVENYGKKDKVEEKSEKPKQKEVLHFDNLYIDVPTDWKMTQDNEGYDIQIDDNHYLGLEIDIYIKDTEEEYFARCTRVFSDRKTVIGKDSIGGRNAMTFSYDGTNGKGEPRHFYYFAFKEMGAYYKFCYSSPDNNEEIFKQVMDFIHSARFEAKK